MRTGIGLTLCLIGAMCADSDKLWIPALMIAVGLWMLKGEMA